MNTYLTYGIIAVVLFVLELVYFRIADKFNIIDKPNERSSHSSIVLRGGGIIFLIGVLVWALVSLCGGFGVEQVGEEAAETIIAAKNGDNDELKNEINDLLYHVMVLCANQGLEWSDVEKVLDERNEKIGNLKTFHQTDKNT